MPCKCKESSYLSGNGTDVQTHILVPNRTGNRNDVAKDHIGITVTDRVLCVVVRAVLPELARPTRSSPFLRLTDPERPNSAVWVGGLVLYQSCHGEETTSTEQLFGRIKPKHPTKNLEVVPFHAGKSKM